MLRSTLISLFSVLILFTAMPKEALAQHSEYGTVDFEVSCDEAVQPDFDRALAMLHNMMYVTARNAFKEITQADPSCAMAYWGVSTTLFQPLWGTRPSQKELKEGWEMMEKAKKLVDSEREELLIESTAAFFREPESADFWTRIDRWTDKVETAYNEYPNDEDIVSLYALTRLTLAQRAEERAPLHDEAESILRKIYEQSPSHPGAIHYTIHSTDVDGRAENALDIVEAYGKIAPDVPHALHMPTHIHVRLGNWSEVINWNLRSADAALNFPVNGSVSHHYAHAIDYLVYAYLQRGEDKKAESAAEKAFTKEPYQASFVSSFHIAAIPARLAVERKNWVQAAELEPRSPDYLPWDASTWATGLTWFAKGLGAVNTNNIKDAMKAEKRLGDLRDEAKANEADDMSYYIEIDRSILAGWIAYEQNKYEEAVELLQSAARLERDVEKHPVTPGALLPANEALGDLFMKLERPKKAFEAYKASDAIWPGRYNTLLGAARAAKATGDKLAAKDYYHRLSQNTEGSERNGAREAQKYIASKQE